MSTIATIGVFGKCIDLKWKMRRKWIKNWKNVKLEEQ